MSINAPGKFTTTRAAQHRLNKFIQQFKF